MLYRHKLINALWDCSSERLTFYKLNIIVGRIFIPTCFTLALPLTFPIFSYNTCLTFRAAKVRVTFSLESLIRLAHGSSFRNPLGVWDVRVGHYRLKTFFSSGKGLTGNNGESRSNPKHEVCPRCMYIGTVLLPSTKTLSYSAKFIPLLPLESASGACHVHLAPVWW